MYKNLAATLVAACAFSVATISHAASPAMPAPKTAADPLKVGFVYVTPVLPAGWTRQHDEGRIAMEKALPGQVKSTVVADVPEGADAERVIRDLASNGHQLIFTTSFGYMEPTLRVAQDFPATKFENLTGYKTTPNVAVANARYYEGRYLSGIAAARMSKTGVAGYVAGMPIPEVIQGINAFTLGMRSVNPQAQVKVVWINTWFDPPREREAAITLFDQGVDVMAFHTASTAIMQAAQERGKLAVAYHSDMRSVGPDAQIVAATHQWGAYYTLRAKAVLAGSWKSGNIWGGVREGMIRMEGFGSKVPAAVQQEVLARQKDLAASKIVPFAAGKQPIADNQGKQRIAAGQSLTDAQILEMNWLVQGVQGQLP